MGSVRIVGEMPSVLVAETADELRHQLGSNVARHSGVSNARDALLMPMVDLVTAAVFPSDDTPASHELFRRPFSHEHLHGRSTTDDARLFRSTLRRVFGLTDRVVPPVIRESQVTDASGTPKRQASWQSLAEIRTPATSMVICEGVIRRPRTRVNSERVVWVDHELVGIAAPVTRRHISKPEARPVTLEMYDTLEVLPGDYGYWQSQLASLW